MMNAKERSDDSQTTENRSLKPEFGKRFTGIRRRKVHPSIPSVFLFFLVSFFVLGPIAPLSPPGLAAEWKVTPKIGVTGGYDDNIYFTEEDKVDSSIVNVGPAVEVDYNALRSSFNLTADWEILSYLDESDLNRVNQYYRFKGDHRLGERWDVRAGLRYYNDTTLKTYLEETGRSAQREERAYAFGSGGLSYDISTVSSIDADYQYVNVRYEDDVYPEYDRHRVSLRYRHRLMTEQDTLLVGPSYYHRTNDSNDTDYWSLDLGWRRDWSDITRTYASIGARYTEVDFADDRDDDDTWGALARFNWRRRGLVSNLVFNYYHDLTTLVDGRDVNVDNLYLSYDHRLTERFGLGIRGRLVFTYDLLDNAEEEEVEDNRYYKIEPFLFYRLTEEFTLSAGYSYENNSKDAFDSEQTRERNRVFIQLAYELPMMM